MEDKVTIVIPTYNRHRQLSRLIDYYSVTNFPILIADSTTEPFKKKLAKNISYFHLKSYPYAKKLTFIYKKVKTKYVLFCADDDFVIVSAIKECVDFLEKNKNYNSAHGHYLFFEDRPDKEIIAYPYYLYAIDIDINGKKPSGRVKQLLSNYMQLLYAVTKTSDIKQVFKLLEDNPGIKNDSLIELFQAIVLCIRGKSKTLPILYCAREVTPKSARTRVPSLERIIFNPNHKKEYRSWVNCIINFLSKIEKISKKESETNINEAIRIYLKPYLLRIPVVNLNLYPLEIQVMINNLTFGMAKKILDILRSQITHSGPEKHAFLTLRGQKEFKVVKKYIEEYHQK